MDTESNPAPVAILLENHRAFLRYLERGLDRGARRLGRIVQPSSRLSFDAARELVSDLCALLSITHGTLINWIYCDQLGVAAEPCYTHHYSGGHQALQRGAAAHFPGSIH